MMDNLYMPYLMRIERITYEAPGVKTFMLKFVDEADQEKFTYKAGQFGEYSVYGVGESTFCIASPPTRKGYIECTFRQTGKVSKQPENSGEQFTGLKFQTRKENRKGSVKLRLMVIHRNQI